MYSNILVALSLEHGISETALSVAKALLAPGGTISVVHVHEPPNSSILVYLDEEVVEKSHLTAQQKLDDRVKGRSDISTVLLEGQSAGRVITEFANTHGADCIVIGSHRPGLKDFFLGSTAARVVRHADCAVHVLRT